MLQPNHSEDEVQKWNQLLDKLAEAESKAEDFKKGASRIFSRMLITIGENKEAIDPWVNLVPNDYGLCIVKLGLLVLLKVWHSDYSIPNAITNYLIYQACTTTSR